MRGVEERKSDSLRAKAAREFISEYKKGGKHGAKQKPEETAERIDRQVEEKMVAFRKEIGLDD